LPLRDVLLTLLVLGSLPVILRRPWIGIVVWNWVSIMNPHRLSWGFAYDFPFALIIAIAVLVGMLFSREPKRLPMARETVVLLLFGFWMVLTTYFALNPDRAWEQFDKVSKVFLMVLVTMVLMREPKRLEALVWIIVLSVGFHSVKGGIFTLLIGGEWIVNGPEGSFIAGGNHLGVAIVMTIPLMRYLQLNTSSFWVRHGLTAAMALTGLSILGTHSRGAFLGGVAIVLVLIWRSRKRFVLAFGLAIMLPVLFSIMPQKWFDRMETIESYEEDRSALGRINAWWFAYNLAKDRPIGGGFETFVPGLFVVYAPDPDDVHDAHSIYFEVLGEHGFPGLFLFLLLGLFTWRSCTWIMRRAREDPEIQPLADLASMITVSLAGYAVSGAFVGLAYFDLYYNLIAMVVIAKTLVKDHLYDLAEADSLEEFAGSREAVLMGR